MTLRSRPCSVTQILMKNSKKTSLPNMPNCSLSTLSLWNRRVCYCKNSTFSFTSPPPTKFYGLPKIHKPDIPLWPIVASRGSIIYNTAKYVANILAPLVGKTPYHIHNSQDLVNKLSNIQLTKEESLVSYDVTTLFTSVPVDDSVSIIHDILHQDPTLSDRTSLSAAQVTELLCICLTTTYMYFVYSSEFYVQKEGAAMGSPVSPIVANLFIEHFEGEGPDLVPSLLKVLGAICRWHYGSHLASPHWGVRHPPQQHIWQDTVHGWTPTGPMYPYARYQDLHPRRRLPQVWGLSKEDPYWPISAVW